MHLAWTSAAKSAKKRKRLAKGGDVVLRAFGDSEDVAAEPTIDDLAVVDEASGQDATCTPDEMEPRRKTRVEETAQLQQRGNALAQAGEFSAALSTWDSAIGLSSVPRQRAVLFEQKAQVLMEMGRLWEAVRAGTCATEIAPDWHDAWVTLARAHLNFGEPHLAQASFSRALLLQPGSTETQQELREASRLAVKQRQLAAAADRGAAEMPTRDEEGFVREGPAGGGQQQEQEEEEQQQQQQLEQQHEQQQQEQEEQEQQQGRRCERGYGGSNCSDGHVETARAAPPADTADTGGDADAGDAAETARAATPADTADAADSAYAGAAAADAASTVCVDANGTANGEQV
ncbi:unnamed protein product [Closterium sp. NIES-53]